MDHPTGGHILISLHHRKCYEQEVNQGAQRLCEVMYRLVLTQAGVGERVGASQAQVSAWCNGHGLPSRRSAVLLQREYGIDPLLWDEPCADDPEAA